MDYQWSQLYLSEPTHQVVEQLKITISAGFVFQKVKHWALNCNLLLQILIMIL